MAVYQIFTVFDMPPGQTGKFSWKNLPSGKAFSIDAQPFNLGIFQGGAGHTTLVEVTRTWRRYRTIQSSERSHLEAPQDILFEIKNVGSEKTHFNVYLIVLS